MLMSADFDVDLGINIDVVMKELYIEYLMNFLSSNEFLMNS